MSVIEGSSVALKTMADGTLRISVDVEPRHAQDAFRLFGAPGTAMALAALNQAILSDDETPAEPPAPAKADKPIAKWLALRCKEPEFQDWLRSRYDRFLGGDGTGWGDISPTELGGAEAHARHAVLVFCDVDSRGKIDGFPEKEDSFKRRVQAPWQKHCIAIGATA